MRRTVFVIVAVLLSAASAQMTWDCASESAPWAGRNQHAAVEFRDSSWVMGGWLGGTSLENDVWSHKQLLKIVSHTPEETERLEASRNLAKFADIARLAVPDEQRLYTWWSYRAKDWAAANRGRRLDHIWVNPAALADTKLDTYKIHLGWRGGWKPSDHAPISVQLKTP